MLDSLLEYGPRLIYSVVLLGLAALFITEIWRVWADNRLYLTPFTYERDGATQSEAGASFARRVGHALRRVQFVYGGGGGGGGAPVASTDQIPGGLSLELPAIKTSTFDKIEVQAYGINFGSLLRGVRGWVRQPNEIFGDVSHYGDSIDVQASLRGTLAGAGSEESTQGGAIVRDWSASGKSVGDVSFELACGVFRYVAEAEHDYFKTVGDADFCQFIEALEHYQKYKALARRNVPEKAKAEHLKAAYDRVAPLIGSRFPFAEKLAGLVHRERNEFLEATTYLEGYLELLQEYQQSDQEIADLVDELKEMQTAAATVPSNGQAFDPRTKTRPLTAGLSISTAAGGGAGTLCCFVRAPGSSEVFALTSEHVVPDATKGSVVLQPSKMDGGKDADAIGEVERVIEASEFDGRAAGALIRLSAAGPESFVTDLPELGKLTGIATSVAPGDNVAALGRSSGLVRGKTIDVKGTMTIGGPSGPIRLNDMILTERLSKPGDSGAPVVTEDGKLIGFIYAGSNTATVVMPIKPVLDAFNVELIHQ